ncbi:flagellar filament capping protein FliD [Bacillus sp. DJP31]|uniref:flagellar filament capping protein FliD n=1 Tax=Bacillus sp. DJP31 TaxID=3409789 RepID=UPI003BB5D75F
MRISGLASGMDTDSLVKDLMKAERIPLDKLKQQKQKLEWQRDGYREMNSLLLSLRNEAFNMKLASKYRVRTVSSSAESKIAATATSSASASSYSISEVKQLASASTKVNTGSISTDPTSKIDVTKDLFSEQAKLKSTSFGWKSGSVESKTIVADTDRPDFNLGLDAAAGTTIGNSSDMVVKVDGKAFKVVATAPTSNDQVQMNTEGTLLFKDPIKKGSSIKVEYVANQKVDTITKSSPFKEIQLTKGSISQTAPLTIKIGTNDYTTSGTEIKDSSNNVVGSIDYTAGKLTFTSEIAIPTGQDKLDVTVKYAQNYFSFDLSTHTSNGQVNEKFLVQGSESLSSVIGKINNSDAGVTAFYDSFTDKMTLTRKETGNFQGADGTTNSATNDPANHEIKTSTGFLDDVLQFGSAVETGGNNAVFTINGLQTERSSNNFEMSGVTFVLKDKLALTDAPISINIGNDTNGVFDNIKKFVEKYNEVIGKIQGKTSETYYRDFLPLTDEQREELSDKQQEQWEEKSKSGLLRRDSLLSSTLSKLRSDFYSPLSNTSVDSKYNQLTSIGITTSPNYLEGGKLYIDEAKLKKAIEESPDSIEKLFTSTGLTDSENGIAQRLYNSIDRSMKKITERAGSSLSSISNFTIGNNLRNIDSQINRFEDRLVRVEDRYWRQFGAMESAISRSNQQSAYLMNAFGSGM